MVSTRTSWRLLVAECLLTINASQAIMPLFCLSIGLTLSEIGLREVIYSIVYLLFSIPTGWFADRLSRKASNVIGDAFSGLALVLLGLSTSFIAAAIASAVLAFGDACTHGADEALFKAHCDALGKDYVDTRKRISFITSWVGVGYYFIGGILTVLYGMKTTVLLASIPFLGAALVSCFIKELGAHKEVDSACSPSFSVRFLSELKEMTRVILFVLDKKQELSWLLSAYVVAAVMGGTMLGLVGLIIIATGGTEGMVGISHVAISLLTILGAWLSRNTFKDRCLPSHLLPPYLILSAVSLLAMATTSIYLTPWTAALQIIIVQVIRVWLGLTLRPLIHKAAPNDIQATIGSIIESAFKVLYMVAMFVAYFVASYGVQWGIAVNILLFTPLVVVVAWRCTRINKRPRK